MTFAEHKSCNLIRNMFIPSQQDDQIKNTVCEKRKDNSLTESRELPAVESTVFYSHHTGCMNEVPNSRRRSRSS